MLVFSQHLQFCYWNKDKAIVSKNKFIVVSIRDAHLGHCQTSMEEFFLQK